jgi:ABC-type branched-subunit amino acid transport system substrate-binding protein
LKRALDRKARHLNRRIWRFIVSKVAWTICLLAALVFFGTSSAAAQSDTARPEKVKVGALLTLSGSFATAGEDCRRGIEAALAVSGARSSLDVIYADSKNEQTTAISEFRKLVQADKVLAVYTHRSTIGMALNPVSLQIYERGAAANRSDGQAGS